MSAAINLDPSRGTRLREFAKHRPVWLLGAVFIALMMIQALGLLLLGTKRAGPGLSECILVLDNLLALLCTGAAFRRARGIAALFWFLFGIVVLVFLVPTAIQAYDTIFQTTTLSDSNRNLIYCLYGAPILMMLFLPETARRERVQAEILLDLFQIAIVVSLIYSTFFFLPAQQMLPADALLRNVSVSDAQSLLLLIAAFVRLRFARLPAARTLLFRLTLFLLACAIATFTGDWVGIHYQAFSPWFDLGWSTPIGVACLVPLTWSPPHESQPIPESANFLSFLGTNLTLVAMLSGIALLTERWKAAHGAILTHTAVLASLLALTLRLALTQFHQHREIVHRRTAQQLLAVSNQEVAMLLNDARRQTSEITQINELGTLLQACASREEAFRVIPERLGRLFPRTSGKLSVLNASRTRAESVAEWGVSHSKAEPFASTDSESVRPASTRPLTSEDSSIFLPLIANGEALGVLALRDNCQIFQSNELTRRKQLASALAEQIALTISNLDLREALQSLAIRDTLTGLYNRRYMEEFLDRESRRALRSERPLSLMMIDVDYFKRYNDTFGHPAGDDALRVVGDALRRSVRAEDLACRYGGEEFVLILPECALEPATVRAEQVRTRLKELFVERSGELPGSITISIGVASFRETTDKVDLLLKFADEALYEAKKAGRDRVTVARAQTEAPRSLAASPRPG